jgi:hypothetical protein
LKLKCDFLVSKFAFKFNFYRYAKGMGSSASINSMMGRAKEMTNKAVRVDSPWPIAERRLVSILYPWTSILVSKRAFPIQPAPLQQGGERDEGLLGEGCGRHAQTHEVNRQSKADVTCVERTDEGTLLYQFLRLLYRFVLLLDRFLLLLYRM